MYLCICWIIKRFKLPYWSKCISVLGSLWPQFLHQTIVRYGCLVQAPVSSSGGIKTQCDINMFCPHSFCFSHLRVYVASFWNHCLHTTAVLFSEFFDGNQKVKRGGSRCIVQTNVNFTVIRVWNMLLPFFLCNSDVDLIPSDSDSSENSPPPAPPPPKKIVTQGGFVKNAMFPSVQRYVMGHTTP